MRRLVSAPIWQVWKQEFDCGGVSHDKDGLWQVHLEMFIFQVTHPACRRIGQREDEKSTCTSLCLFTFTTLLCSEIHYIWRCECSTCGFDCRWQQPLGMVNCLFLNFYTCASVSQRYLLIQLLSAWQENRKRISPLQERFVCIVCAGRWNYWVGLDSLRWISKLSSFIFVRFQKLYHSSWDSFDYLWTPW